MRLTNAVFNHLRRLHTLVLVQTPVFAALTRRFGHSVLARTIIADAVNLDATDVAETLILLLQYSPRSRVI